MSFRRLETGLSGVVLIEPAVHIDARGYLVETYRDADLRELGIELDFVQENQSHSLNGVLRGIHAQAGQAKLVRCSRGRVFDVAVDLRPNSPSFRHWVGYELDDERHLQLLIPAGFGHGFCILTDEAEVVYRISTYHDPDLEFGISWDDPDLAIDWPVSNPTLSDRDRAAPRLAEIQDRLTRTL